MLLAIRLHSLPLILHQDKRKTNPRISSNPPNPSDPLNAEDSHYMNDHTVMIPITPVEDGDVAADVLSHFKYDVSQSRELSPGIFEGSNSAPLPSVEKLICNSCESLERLPLYTFPKLQTLLIIDCQMLNLSLDNENSIQKLRMKHLYLQDFPKLLTLPRWIVCAADTLESLYIVNFRNLKSLPEYLTTMTRLKRFYICGCSQLLSLPSGLHRLSILEFLAIWDCPGLYQKCQPHSGEYWPMIRHIKNIDTEGEEE